MPRGGLFDSLNSNLDKAIERQEKSASGTTKFARAKQEWSPAIAKQQVDIPIEELLSSDYFWGKYNIWPKIRDELQEIWHIRCDFDVIFYKGYEIIKRDTIYAVSFERAEERAREKWPRLAREATDIRVTRKRNIHTVVIEAPKGSGKDFEAGLAVPILVREFMVQDRVQFCKTYNLDINTTFSVNCMNRSEEQAKKVTFSEVLGKFKIPFFMDYLPPQVDFEQIEERRIMPSELRLPMNMLVFPGTGTAASGLGYCIVSGVIDEVNFMEKSDTSKRSLIGAEEYDAAEEVYHDMLHRHESRFAQFRDGRTVYAGLVFCISSSNTDFDFTKRMKRKAEEDDGIYYTSSYFWERKPLNLSGVTFDFDTNSLSLVDPKKAEEDYAEMLKTHQPPSEEALSAE